MGEVEYLKNNRKKAERIVMIIFTIYAIIMEIASILLQWSTWSIPIFFCGLFIAWVVYVKEAKTYRFRAFLVAGLTLINFCVYSAFSESFAGSLLVFGSIVILLGIYDIPEIVYVELTFSIVVLLYQGFYHNIIPFDTMQNQIGSLVQIGTVYIVEGLIYYLIKTHREMNQKLYEVIGDLKVAERSKNDFLSNVSHEIRTPINTVCGMSEMILREEISDSVREDTFNIQASGRNLLSIVSDVLDYSELESGKMELIEEPYNLTSTINDVINMAIAHKSDKKLELIVDCDAKIPYSLLGDEQKLRRVILCFVDNAIKFTETGCITIEVSARKEEYGINLCVKVRDTGIGISEENLEKLFQSFNQVDTRKSRQEGGIGIGLAIAKKIVSQMGGFINVKSEVDKGSEFQFVIPQKVLDDRPMVTVKNRENINIIGYINSEKYQFAEIRDDYMRSIRHMVEGLEVPYQSCRNLQEFKRRMEKEIYTHAFITIDEYSEDTVYFDKISNQLELIIVQSRDDNIAIGDNIRCIYKPFYVLSIASILNGEYKLQRLDGSHYMEKKFIAPEANVLVVDDNLMNLKVVEGLLRPYKIKVFVATSGKEALAKVESMRYDIIFMDHMMPEMDGVETAHNIRKKPGIYFQNVPIVALTANAIGGAREMFLSEGFQEYVAKPIELSHFERVLRKFIPEDKIIQIEEEEATGLSGVKSTIQKTEKQSQRLSKPVIDRQKGLNFCGGNEEDYNEILQIYLNSGQQTMDYLDQLFLEKDWNNYIIQVHALKSTSISIGADALGEMAKNLEFAGKHEDYDYINVHHEECRKEYLAVLSEIAGEDISLKKNENRQEEKSVEFTVERKQENEQDNIDECIDLDKENFLRKLDELESLLNTFEKEEVENKIDELSQYSYQGKKVKALLKNISSKIEEYDFCTATEYLEQLKKKGGNMNVQ